MRKSIFGRRLLGVLMALCMVLGTSVVAFAAEKTETVSTVSEEAISPRVGAQVSTPYISAGGEGQCRPNLPVTGYGKVLRLHTISTVSQQSGAVTMILYAPDGSYLKAWNVNIGASQEYRVNYPAAGNYTLIVYNDTNGGIYVEAQWI